jgi:hypothetical protein
MRSRPTNVLDRVSSRGCLLGLPLVLALCTLELGATANISRADGDGAAASPQVGTNPSSQTIAITPVVQAEKPIVLPKYEVNGLRERLDDREKIIEKDTGVWAGFLRLDNGVLIDNVLFLCKYKAEHPNELVRLVISGASDEEAQRLLMEAYERKDMNQRTLTSFKRVIDQRRHFGRKYGPRGKEGPGRTSAESMVRAYQRETQRQKLMVKKGKLCEARLLSVSAACKDIRTAPPVNA